MPTLKYANNAGVIGRTRISNKPGFVAVAGTEPAGAAQGGVYFRKSGSRKQAGSQVRFINCRVADGPLTPSGAQPYRYASATVLTQAAFNAISEGSTVTLNGVAYEVFSKTDEG